MLRAKMRFERAELPLRARQLRLTAGLGSAAYVLSLLPEWWTERADVFWGMQAAPRMVVGLLGAWIVWRLPRVRRVRSFARINILYGLTVALAFVLTSASTLAPPATTALALVIFTLTCALFLPLEPFHAFALAALPTVTFHSLQVWRGTMSFVTTFGVLVVSVLALILCPVTAARLRAARRLAFTNLRAERRARRLAERLGTDFSRLFDRSPAPLAISMVESGALVLVNDRTRELFGIPLDRDVSDLSAARFYRDPADRRAFIRRLRHDGWADFEVGLQTLDGRPIEASMRAYPIRYENRDALVAGFIDLSEERRVAEALRVARDEAESASRMKSQFLAHVSHEIRTPMNGVVGMASVLAETELSDDQAQMVDVIASSGKSLLRIIDDILDLSKVEAGMLSLSPRPFSPRLLARDVDRTLRFRAEARGLRFTVTVHDDVPDGLLGDEGRLRQILINLAGNALKFTSRGGVDITIGHRLSRTGGAGLCCVVTDTGVGLTPEQLERIFLPFVQADGTATRYGGTGLGLSISRLLAEMMDGELGAESRPEGGARFWLEVPLPIAILPAEHATGDLERTEVPAGLRVLLAEDNAVNRRVAMHMLRRLPIEVDVAEDGQAAIERLRERRYDVVLMDLEMPEVDGIAATRWLRRHEVSSGHPRTPVVALTAHALCGNRSGCLDAGMDDYLTKPVNPRQLRAALARWSAARQVNDPAAC